MALCHWVQLSLTEGLGPVLARRLVEAAGGAEAACKASSALVQSLEGIGPATSRQILDSLRKSADAAMAELDRAAACRASVICLEDQAYPTLLKSIPDPPCVLYVRGDLQPRDLNAIAIVGSRRCSFYGREQAERFGALLAGAGMTIVSGGARGIDSAAHRGALAHPLGRTFAVLGCGIDIAYPPENTELLSQIAARGAIISEHPLGTPPVAENFPRRNRIISGLARGVLVIEADQRSGALITARLACEEHGRPVFALPGRVDNRLSAGPHQLIRDGATLVRNLEDVLDGLGPLPQEAVEPTLFDRQREADPDEPPAQASSAELSDSQRAILGQIDADPTSVEQIAQRTCLPVSQVLQELTFMSLKGVVRRVGGQNFVRRN